MLAKAIGHNVANVFASLFVAIETYRTKYGERTQIVNATHMVVVDVRHEYGVERLKR